MPTIAKRKFIYGKECGTSVLQDVAYLAKAVGNITECHAAGQLHQGGGACFSPIPLCPALPKVNCELCST